MKVISCIEIICGNMVYYIKKVPKCEKNLKKSNNQKEFKNELKLRKTPRDKKNH